MALEYALESPLLRMTARGDVAYEEGLRVFSEAVDASRAAGGSWHLLFDIRETRENRSADELRGVADFIAAHQDVFSGRAAIVAADDFHFALSRMFQVFCEGRGLDVRIWKAKDLAAAEAWLAAGGPASG